MQLQFFSSWCLWQWHLLPPLTELAGGLQPAAQSPEPESRAADTTSWTVNLAGTRTATAGGSAARSPPMCRGVSETLTAPHTHTHTWNSNQLTGSVIYLELYSIYEHQLINSDRLVTIGHDGLYDCRAGGEAVLPVVTSGTVVAHKHTPLQCRHQPTPLPYNTYRTTDKRQLHHCYFAISRNM